MKQVLKVAGSVLLLLVKIAIGGLCLLITCGLLGMAGYMEYYVQRNAHKAILAYSVMGSCLAAVVILGLLIHLLSHKKAPAVTTE